MGDAIKAVEAVKTVEADGDVHLDADKLWRFMAGGLAPAEMRLVLRHLLGGCGRCQDMAREVWNLAAGRGAEDAEHPVSAETPRLPEARSGESLACPDGPTGAPSWTGGARPPTPTGGPAESHEGHGGAEYDTVLDRVCSRFTAEEAGIEAARRRAAGLFEELTQHPPARQQLLVQNSTRFRDHMLCESLLAASHDEGFRDPARSLQLARLAVAVAERLAEAAGDHPGTGDAPRDHGAGGDHGATADHRAAGAAGAAGDHRAHPGLPPQATQAHEALELHRRPLTIERNAPEALAAEHADAARQLNRHVPAERAATTAGELLAGLRARAWAQLGNALRLGCDLEEAAGAFRSADALLAAHPRLGLLDKARVLDLKASLYKDRQQFAAAAGLLDRVIAIYRRLGQSNQLGRALSQKATVLFNAGDIKGCMPLLRQALELIDPHEDPRWFLIVRHNLISALVEDDRPREAFALLFHTRPLYLKMGDRMNLLRLRWLEGQVAQGLHRLEQAEAAFREVRDAFVELGLRYDAAVVSLDLAAVFARQGRATEMRHLAQEMLAVLEPGELHREAMAAFLVFCTSAQREQANLGLVQEVAAFLKQARNAPDLRFSPRGQPPPP